MLPAQEERSRTLAEFARYTGRVMPAEFFQKTAEHSPQIGVERFHTLYSGIYKPAWSEYALCIKMTPDSPYSQKDEVVFLEDGRWLMDYSPRSGGLDLSDNRALVKCKDERLPLAVIQQVATKRQGTAYKVLGLGIITNYDPQRDVFVVESADVTALALVSSVLPNEAQRYEVQLYAQLSNEFRPFHQIADTIYLVSATKRDEAFREVLLDEYDYACAACGRKFLFEDLFEAQAAHIIPKRVNGTDDPRNGLALCRSHHWAFDVGLWTLTPKYDVLVSPMAQKAEIRNFELLELDGKPLREPSRDAVVPHLRAVDWHNQNIWRKA